MEDIKKSCINCRYYIEHYVWHNNRFFRTNCGHCLINPCTKKFRKTLPLKNGCDKWENAEIKIVENETRIKQELLQMAERVNRIIKYFERDDNV